MATLVAFKMGLSLFNSVFFCVWVHWTHTFFSAQFWFCIELVSEVLRYFVTIFAVKHLKITNASMVYFKIVWDTNIGYNCDSTPFGTQDWQRSINFSVLQLRLRLCFGEKKVCHFVIYDKTIKKPLKISVNAPSNMAHMKCQLSYVSLSQ